MRRLLFLLVPVLIATGCNKKDTFIIDGVIDHQQQRFVYINRVDVNTPVLVDSAKVRKNGRFRIKVKSVGPDFFQLGYSSSDFITLLAEPGEKITLHFTDLNLSNNYSVSGSRGSEQVQILDLKLLSTKRKLDSLTLVYEKASKEPGFEVKGPLLEKEYTDLIKEQRKNNIEFIVSNVNSLASIKALYQKINADAYVLYEPRDLQYLKIVTDSLLHHYPNSNHVQALARDFKKEMNQMYANQLIQITGKAAETKLDPNLISISGKRVALSSLKGKYVLLTFWSAESKECISENLQLKEFYKTYNRKGFEIYQINLDESEEAWKSAVHYDELPWICTREDDPLNPINARLFNVKALPANYLFDKNGKIVGSNLHGKTLQLKLEQIFNN
jgi:thiol-disulfide isomerase/thioredoxin